MKKHQTETIERTEKRVQEKLSRSAADSELSSSEECLLRMRHGIGLDPDAPLPRKAVNHPETASKLRKMEADLILEMRRRSAIRIDTTERTDYIEEYEGTRRHLRPRPADSRIKSKIIRSLRKKS